MQPAKRRRIINDAASSVHKPFKSPLRANKVPSSDSACNKPHREQDDIPALQSKTSPASSPKSNKSLQDTSQSSPVRKLPLCHTSPRRHSKIDPDHLQLQKQHTALLLQLSKLRQDLDTVQQALKIETADQDKELEQLTSRWRTAAREAAEELFRGAKDKVNKMGGVGAWRERTRKKSQGWYNDEQEEPDLDRMTDEQREQYEEQKDAFKLEKEKYFPEQKANLQEKDDDVR